MNQPTEQELDKMLEHVKKDVFLGKNASFLGSVLCSQDFSWDRDARIDTVGTNCLHIYWCIKDFLDCSKDERASTLVHELWHTALLHHLRIEKRDPKLWNIACDYRINNNLRADGYFIPDTWIVNPDIDRYGILSEEEIYEKLVQHQIPQPQQYSGDLLQNAAISSNPSVLISAVVRAVQASELSNQAGNLPGSLKEILKTFLEPVIPWRSVLMQWMTDLHEEDYTWKRPNRRFQDLYMPSREPDEGRLAHLAYFEDVSGSITQADKERFNSEVKFVQEVLKPKKLTLIQFDTAIAQVREFNEDELFEEIEIGGGGGTSLRPVHNWIEKHKPTAAIIFSDLECAPMESLSVPIPVIWVAIRNQNAQVPFGKLIHIVD